MKKSIYLLLFFGIFIFNTSIANNPEKSTSISGKVIDENNEPVVGAFISVSETFQKTISDIDGTFNISQLNPGKYVITIKAIGYETQTLQLKVNSEGIKDLVLTFKAKLNDWPPVNIVGINPDRLFSKVSGGLSVIDKAEINNINPISGNEVFKRISGLQVVDEEGAGLRINMGIRGLDPDRSRRVLMLEDGVPIAQAPYGEPEMYYTPAIEKMEGVEVMKGAGQILYGPQTIGGVVNFISKALPDSLYTNIRLQGGSSGFYNIFASHGNKFDQVGYLINIHKKGADDLGMLDFGLFSADAKIEFYLSNKSQLTAKFGFYQEESNATYIGLNQPMFDGSGQDFVRMAPDDRLNVNRSNFSVVHQYKINSKTKWKNLVYGHQLTRNWARQDFAFNGSDNNRPENFSGQVWGNEEIPNGAIYMKNSNGHRNRSFDVFGAESRIDHSYEYFGMRHKVQGGVRYLHERAFEERVNGAKSDAKAGDLVAYEERPGKALSTFVQQQSSLGNRLHVHYGVRHEYFVQEREIFRGKYNGIITDTFLNNANIVQQFIPGGGATFIIDKSFIAFGGIHRGFAPPRTKDAIDNDGGTYELEAELSNNYEFGFRGIAKGFQFEITGFRMVFENQIIPISQSSGGSGTGLINAGATLHQGIEGALTIRSSDFFKWDTWQFTLNSNLTLIDARFTGDRFINNVNINNLQTPYAPNFISNSIFQIDHITGFGFRVAHQYVGQQFTDIANTVVPNPNGRTGLMPSYAVWDVNAFYEIKNKWRFTAAVKNVTNERYIASRRPQGIRVGLPRLFIFGVEKTF
jgi:Fe(3+) dicitrate transport protein